MSDRFVYDGLYPEHYSSHITDKETGKTYLIKGIVDVLNEQDKEIKKLRKELTKVLARQIPNNYEEYREKYGKVRK